MTPTIINEPFESTVTCWNCTQTGAHTHTRTHGLDSLLFTGDSGNDARLNVADGTSHSIQILSFLSFPNHLKSLSKDKQQLEQNWPLISDQTTEGRSTLSLLRRQGAWMQHRVLNCSKPWWCRVRKSERVFRHPLNFLRGGYQRAEASSASLCDDRCCNESSNES